MSRQIQQRTFDDALSLLKQRGFEINVTANKAALAKNGVVASIQSDGEGKNRYAKLAAAPALMIGGEPAKLIDRGYQKIFKTSKLEMGASADNLRALHQFSEELKEVLGMASMYNESLGTVSDEYMYDRLQGRDKNPPPSNSGH